MQQIGYVCKNVVRPRIEPMATWLIATIILSFTTVDKKIGYW